MSLFQKTYKILIDNGVNVKKNSPVYPALKKRFYELQQTQPNKTAKEYGALLIQDLEQGLADQSQLLNAGSMVTELTLENFKKNQNNQKQGHFFTGLISKFREWQSGSGDKKSYNYTNHSTWGVKATTAWFFSCMWYIHNRDEIFREKQESVKKNITLLKIEVSNLQSINPGLYTSVNQFIDRAGKLESALTQAASSNQASFTAIRTFSSFTHNNLERTCFELMIDLEKETRVLHSFLKDAKFEQALEFSNGMHEKYYQNFIDLSATNGLIQLQKNRQAGVRSIINTEIQPQVDSDDLPSTSKAPARPGLPSTSTRHTSSESGNSATPMLPNSVEKSKVISSTMEINSCPNFIVQLFELFF